MTGRLMMKGIFQKIQHAFKGLSCYFTRNISSPPASKFVQQAHLLADLYIVNLHELEPANVYTCT